MNTNTNIHYLKTLPGDDVRQIMWRFSDRFDLQMLIQSSRAVAKGVTARLVANGARNTHEWTEEKNQLLKAFDESGISTVFLDPEFGGYIEGPKNLAMALVAFELAWVDGGTATCSLAGNLALSPIHEKGTYEQRKTYMSGCVPAQPGENRKTLKGAFALTEPLPYVGVDASMISGKAKIVEWEEGKEPVIQIEKRGRFITNMNFANFITAAVDTADERIKSSFMVILEEDDPGVFDRGTVTKKMVHQLSSTCDPIFSLKVPASRIIGGYTVKDGVIYPNANHGEVIEAVFRRTRVTVALMSSAKVLSAIEPVIRYHRTRFRGGESVKPGTLRYDLGLQQKEDALTRLADVWAHGEASSSLGFAAARLFDEFDPIERAKDKLLEEQGIKGPRAKMKAHRKVHGDAMEYISLMYQKQDVRDNKRFQELGSNVLVEFVVKDAVASVLCPASKLWNTGVGANMMREAVSLVGGYGITEDCPGFLFQKWTDMQLEATYEGPEVVQRRQLSLLMNSELFVAHFKAWALQLQGIHKQTPSVGALALANSMDIWLWVLNFLQSTTDSRGDKLYQPNRHGVSFTLADALCWLLSSHSQIMDVLELIEKGPQNPVLAEGLPGFTQFFSDLCVIQSAKAAGEVTRFCTELVFGYNAKQTLNPSQQQEFEGLVSKVNSSLFESRYAKERAGQSLAQVMIPEALDYPQQ